MLFDEVEYGQEGVFVVVGVVWEYVEGGEMFLCDLLVLIGVYVVFLGGGGVGDDCVCLDQGGGWMWWCVQSGVQGLVWELQYEDVEWVVYLVFV